MRDTKYCLLFGWMCHCKNTVMMNLALKVLEEKSTHLCWPIRDTVGRVRCEGLCAQWRDPAPLGSMSSWNSGGQCHLYLVNVGQ